MTYKSRGVIIPGCLCVAECLEKGVGVQDDVLDVLQPRAAARDLRHVVHDELRRHSLAST